MREKKYIVIPDQVESQHDGQVHRISASRLMQLYGVAPEECLVVRPDAASLDSIVRRLPNAKILRPRYDGHYILDENGLERAMRRLK